MDTTTLINRCALGDRDAMEILYRTYAPRMMRVIRRYITDKDSAEDILHDGFIVVYTHIGELRSSDRLEYWMGTIMKNIALQHLRELDVATILEDAGDEVFEDFEDIITLEELQMLIDRLPDGYRTVFRMAVLENKSHKEISQLLGIGVNTSTSQLYHARLMLRKLINAHRNSMLLIVLLLITGGVALLLDRNNGGGVLQMPQENQTVNAVAETLTLPEPEAYIAEAAVADIPFATFADNPTTADASQNDISNEESSEESAMPTASEAETDAADTVRTAIPVAQGLPEPPLFADIPQEQDNSLAVGLLCSAFCSAINHTAMDFMSSNLDSAPPGETTLTTVNNDFSLPFVVGVSFAKTVSRRLSIETGLRYTLMQTRTTYRNDKESGKRTLKAHYLGIPVLLRYNICTAGAFSFYAIGGGGVDFPIAKQISESGTTVQPKSRKLHPQFSLSVGVGAQIRLSRTTSLFVEPSVSYYFDSNTALPLLWQEKPVSFSLPVGIRFEW